MRTHVEKSDFRFIPSGFGVYKVYYTSPRTGKTWRMLLTDMFWIDTIQNEDYPRKFLLYQLMRKVKREGSPCAQEPY